VAAWLDSLGHEHDALAALRGAAKDGDGERVRQFGAKSAGNDQRARGLARAIGLVDCANS